MTNAGDEAGLLLYFRARSPARIASRRVSMPSPVKADTAYSVLRRDSGARSILFATTMPVRRRARAAPRHPV